MSENNSVYDFQNRIDLQQLNKTAQELRNEIGKYIIGQKNMIDYLLIAIFSDGHVLIEGVPGVAKTLTAKLTAKTIDAKFSRIQFTPDLMPSDVLGTSIFNQSVSQFEFKPGPIFGNIVLIDEINRSPAKTQAALFEVMEERQVTVDGQTYKMEEPFMVLATQNPVEHEGTYRLPEAQLDRFLFKITVDYPTDEEEFQILGIHDRDLITRDLGDIKALLKKEDIAEIRKKVSQIRIEENLRRFIAQLIGKTRNNNSLFLGASPRASIAVMKASKALAALNGRDFVLPEDIREVIFPVLRHRIVLSPEKEMEGLTPDAVIKQILKSTEVPR
jgi:MoxR-like ATPase